MSVVALPRVRVEPLDQEDLDMAAVFLLKVWRDTYRRTLPRRIVEERSTGYFRDYLKKRASTCRLAWLGDRLVGLATTQQNCVDDLWVAPRFRRRGIGTALLEAATGGLRERGYQYAQAGCEDFNDSAMAFFDRAGWDCIGGDSITLTPGYRVNAMVFSRRLPGTVEGVGRAGD
ncbi:MAG: GNAT family N-acetyltransferase [Gammaproteobacteria bacterium]|nr:GNAT family N-acetyltransferase [Gammaproteobacteria bacterium]